MLISLSTIQDTKDTFADVPLNLPKPKTRLEFPKEWLKPKKEESSSIE